MHEVWFAHAKEGSHGPISLEGSSMTHIFNSQHRRAGRLYDA